MSVTRFRMADGAVGGVSRSKPLDRSAHCNQPQLQSNLARQRSRNQRLRLAGNPDSADWQSSRSLGKLPHEVWYKACNRVLAHLVLRVR
jgi:hypothetical protein